MYVHALHTVHALPDLRIAGGRLGDGVSFYISLSGNVDLSLVSFECVEVRAHDRNEMSPNAELTRRRDFTNASPDQSSMERGDAEFGPPLQRVVVGSRSRHSGMFSKRFPFCSSDKSWLSTFQFNSSSYSTLTSQ
jgi:hypothetical protein